MKSAVWILAALAVTGCASAVISDIATDKVKVVAVGDDAKLIMAEAEKGCAIYKRKPVPISSRCIASYCSQKEYLFACQEPG